MFKFLCPNRNRCNDAINSTYGIKAINFWDDVATSSGYILSNLDAGDGVHLNDAGHKLLFEKVIAKNINALSCNAPVLGVNTILFDENFLKVYPNPTSGNIIINFKAVDFGELKVQFFDAMGRQLLTNNSFLFNSGNNTIPVNLVENLAVNTQVIFGLFTFKTANGVVEKRVPIVLK